MYENLNLKDVVTLVDFVTFEKLLIEANYDRSKMCFLIDGFRYGFEIGYEGSRCVLQTALNLKFRGVGSKLILWNKVMKEVKLGRYAGPFKEIPFRHFIKSPIGLVPKDNGKATRLIFHLSYPRGQNCSLNVNTPKTKTRVEYPEFDQAIRLISILGIGCKIGKSDMTSAFRHLSIRPVDWCLLVMKAHHPVTGEVWFFMDKCLPFGAAITCAVAHLVRFRTKSELINYLDDYLFAAMLRRWYNKQISIFMQICAAIRFPVSAEKMFWSMTRLVFLGLLIDTIAQVVMIPVDKIETAVDLISQVLSKRKITMKQIQKICGFLNFLGRAVVPGRAFTRRLYTYTSSKGDKVLKPHHHIKINLGMHEDLGMWLKFLQHPTVYCRLFLDFDKVWHATEISIYSDASHGETLGFGGICEDSWMYGRWEDDFIKDYEPNIAYLELYALAAGVINWLHRFRNRRIVLFCDNQSIVGMVNKTTASCKNYLALIHILVYQSLIHNTRVFTKYVPSKSNKALDFFIEAPISKIPPTEQFLGCRTYTCY